VTRTGASRYGLAHVLGLMVGCASATVRSPPAQVLDPLAVVDCTPDASPAAVDVMLGSLLAVLTVVAGAADSHCSMNEYPCFELKPVAVVSGITSFALISSAVSARGAAHRCREFKEAQRRCEMGHLPACRQIAPRWEPPPGYLGIGSTVSPATPARTNGEPAPQPTPKPPR